MQEMLPYVHLMWSSPYQIILALVFLWRQIGPSMLTGVAVMGVTIPATAILGKKIKDQQRNLMSLRDERVKITNEVFGGMKVSSYFICPNECPMIIPMVINAIGFELT